MTSLDLCDKGSYPKYVRTLRTFPLNCFFTSLKIEFNHVIINHMAVTMQLSTVSNIFEITALKAKKEVVENYLEYRTKTHIKPCNF